MKDLGCDMFCAMAEGANGPSGCSAEPDWWCFATMEDLIVGRAEWLLSKVVADSGQR
jgi:hypothetical protein